MHRLTTLPILTILTILLLMAYKPDGKAQAVREGNLIVDGFYGWPNLFTTFMERIVLEDSTGPTGVHALKFKGHGPFGARVEYLVADRIGVGVEFNTARSSMNFMAESNQQLYSYKVGQERYRLMMRFSYYVVSEENFAAYLALGAGYRHAQWFVETDDPDYDRATFSGLWPIAARIALGGRYFFTDFIGLNVEMGFSGGPLIAGGVSFKL